MSHPRVYRENDTSFCTGTLDAEPSPRVQGKHFLIRVNTRSSRKIDSLYVFPYVGWV